MGNRRYYAVLLVYWVIFGSPSLVVYILPHPKQPVLHSVVLSAFSLCRRFVLAQPSVYCAVMGVLDLFRSRGFDPDTYERELTSLNKEISSILAQKLRIDHQRNRVVSRLRMVALLVFVLTVYYNYLMAPAVLGKNFIQRFLRSQTRYQLLFYAVFPAVAVAVIRLILALYSLLYRQKDKQLVALRKKLRNKIEHMKKITNFETTSTLLSKYGTAAKEAAPPSQEPGAAARPLMRKKGVNPKPKLAATINAPSANAPGGGKPPANASQRPISPAILQGPRPISDRLLDLLIGSDNNESLEDRYALICQNCYAHNGLAPPGSKDPFKVVYMCPKCGFVNGDKESIKGEKTAGAEANTGESRADVKGALTDEKEAATEETEDTTTLSVLDAGSADATKNG